MSEICDRCGKGVAQSWNVERKCFACIDVVAFFTERGLSGDRFSAWLERVIDRRIQKALAARELP